MTLSLRELDLAENAKTEEKARQLLGKWKFDDNGNIRRTKVSKVTGEIHGHLWNEILKKQLQVGMDYFNCKI